MRGFAQLVQHRRARAAAARTAAERACCALAPDQAAVRPRSPACAPTGAPALSQDEALDVLAAYGMPVGAGPRACSADGGGRRPPRCSASRSC